MAGPFTTPLGRIVQGDPYKPAQRRDQQGKGRVQADGTPDMQHFVAIAIPKNDPEYDAFYASVHAEDRAAWPTLFDAAGNCLRQDFAFKIVDGDSAMLDKSGVAPNSREGWAGCWVWKFASKFAPKVMVPRNGVWAESPGGEMKCGDWGRVSFSTVSNQSAQTPGMYRNLEQIAKFKDDTAIASAGSGPSASERFGAPPPAGNAPSPAPAASPPPLAATTPPPPTASPTSAPPPPPAPAILHVMTEKAAGASYDSFVGNGWTDQQMIDAGYMVA